MLLALPELIQRYGMSIAGVLHVGAHAGQEAELYQRCGIPRVLWIEANPDLMAALDARVEPLGHVTVCACAGAREGEEVVLNISESPDGTNQGQSSSVLRLGTHAIVHPEVRYVGRRVLRTRTIASILERHWRWREPANFMNLDVQGYELECLKGAEPALERFEWPRACAGSGGGALFVRA